MLRISYELSSAIEYRERNRLFGNIDNAIPRLSASEIINHEMEIAFTSEMVANIFNRDDIFFKEFDSE